MLAFGEYRPDLNDLNQAYTSQILNVLPRADGYGPLSGWQSYTQSLPDPCKGGFFARNRSGGVVIFAATATDLYQLDNTTFQWILVSQGGVSYPSVSTDSLWQFVQFGDRVLATQQNTVVQQFNLVSDTEFSDLPGTPPQAAYIAVINRFVLLSGLLSEPYRIQWCGLNDPENWTPGVNASDFQDFPDGGIVRGSVGGDLGYVFQDQCIRRMVFSPGSDEIFDISKIIDDLGLLCPYSLVSAGDDNIFFLSAKGFQRLSGGALAPIGKERVDRTVLGGFDATAPQFVLGTSTPDANRVIWVYRRSSNSMDNFDSAIIYDAVLDRWSPAVFEGQYLSSFARPGTTLEGLGPIAPGASIISDAVDNGSGLVRLTVASTSGWATNDWKTIFGVGGVSAANGTFAITVIDGTHIDLQGTTFSGTYTSGGVVCGSLDALGFSLDDISAATLAKIAMFDTNGSLGFFSGPNLEATLLTSEQSAVSQRMFVQGFYPLTDAQSVFGNVQRRENLNADPSSTAEKAMNARGFVPARADTRHARGCIRIPAGQVWTYAKGMEPLVVQRGVR